MATRFTAAGGYSRALSGGAQAAYTMACWGRIDVDRNAASTFLDFDDGVGTDYVILQTAADGTSLQVVESFNVVGTIALTVGTWYFMAVSVNAGTGTLYVRPLGTPTWTTLALTGLKSSLSMVNARIGDSVFAEPLNGSVTAAKFWFAALSQAELDAEYGQHVPSRTAGLRAWYPLAVPELTDYSGNSQTLTAATGTSYTDGPEIPWGAKYVEPVTAPRLWLPSGTSRGLFFRPWQGTATALPPPAGASNDFDGGGTAGATLTTSNAGGTGDTQFDFVSIGSGASVTLDSTHAHSGSLSLKCNVGTGPADAGFEWSTAIGPLTAWYTRVYYYAGSNPTNHHRIYDAVTAGGAALCSGVMHHTDGTLILLDGGFGIAAQTSTAIALNQWVRIETYFVGAAVGGYVELRLFNSPESTTPTETISASSVNTSGTATNFRFGFNGDAYDTNRTMWLDDIAITNQGWLGPASAAPPTITAETATAYASRFTDDFGALAPIGHVDGDSFGHWTVQFDDASTANVVPVDVSGTRYLRVQSADVGGGAGTSASLVTSREAFTAWSTLAVEYITDSQFRTPTPNNWEVGWVFFNYSNNNSFYYVLLCPDGYWELGKEWHNGVSQQQDFLAFGTAPVTWPLGDRLRVEVDQTLSGTSLTLNVRAKDITRGDASFTTLVSNFTDDGSRSSGAAYLSGSVGLYCEDSSVRFATVELDSPSLLNASTAIAPTAGTATAAGAAFDATVAITFPAGSATGTGTAHDAQADVGPQPTTATGTGAGFDASLAVTVAAEQPTAAGSAGDATAAVGANAQAATGTGAAQDASPDLGAAPSTATGTGAGYDAGLAITVAAGQAAATGTAGDATLALGVLAGDVSDSYTDIYGDVYTSTLGIAYDATAATSANITPNAEAATGTGTAFDATVAITVNAEQAAATGTAPDAQAGIGPLPDTAAGTGTAYDVAGLTVTFGAEAATAVGTAPDAQANVAPLAGLAAGTGTAYDVDHVDLTVTPDTAVAAGSAVDAALALTAPAGAASGTGTAYDAAAGLGALAEAAAVVGAAWDALTALGITAEQSAGTGTAYDATVTTDTSVSAPAEAATGTGTAYDAAVAIGPAAEAATAAGAAQNATAAVAPAAESAAGVGTALDAGTAITATAGQAAAAGTAPDAVAAVGAAAGTASGSGSAADATTAITVNAETAAATGTAYDAAASTNSQLNVPAEAASGTGSAFDASVLIGPAAEAASGTVTALNASIDLGALAQLAAAVGSAWPATVTGGVTPRPFTGTTARPYAGTTARP